MYIIHTRCPNKQILNSIAIKKVTCVIEYCKVHIKIVYEMSHCSSLDIYRGTKLERPSYWALWNNKLTFIIHIKLFLLEICVKIKRFLEFSRQGLSIGKPRIRHRKDQQSKDLMERPHHVIGNEWFRLIFKKNGWIKV